MPVAEDQAFDAFAAAYDEYSEATRQPLLPWLASEGVQLSGRAVDLGCGAGRHCNEFADAFDEVVGVDLSESLIALARAKRSRPNVTYAVGDLTTYTDAEPFDLVFSSTALHHVPDLDAALGHIRTLVRPGGWVVLRDTVRVANPRLVWLWRHGGVYVGPITDFVERLRTDDWRTAYRLLRFQISRPWIRHVLADRWLTYAEFEQRYTAVFEGGVVSRPGGLTTLVWQCPPSSHRPGSRVV